nr:MAG TPA_asm: hypothetical protein [Caudoviricetes sp.]
MATRIHKGLRQCLGATSGLRDIPSHRGRRKQINDRNRKFYIPNKEE